MSNNAVSAYNKGSMPLSKWNKKNIVEAIKKIADDYSLPINLENIEKQKLKELKENYLKQDGYHHTSKFYNATDFFKVDIENLLNKLNPLNYDYINHQVTGEKINIEMNRGVTFKKIEPQKISSELPFEISQKPSDNRKNIVEYLNLKGIKGRECINENTQEKVLISSNTINKSISNIKISDEAYVDFCKILVNIENLFKTSQKILSHSDTKRETNQKISRYANIAKIDNNIYLLEFVTKKDGNIFLYSVNTLSNEKQYRENAFELNSLQHDTASYSISDIQDIFNSKLVKNYNNDYKNLLNNNIKPKFQSMISGINPKQKVDVIDLTNHFPKDSILTKNDLITHIKSLIGTTLKSKDKKAILNFIKSSKRIGKKNEYMPKHIVSSSFYDKSHLLQKNTAVKNIIDLIQNSILIDIEANKDKKVKPNVDNYLRFYVPIQINNDIYTIRISAENNTKNNLFNILSADVYDVIIDKEMTASRPSTEGNIIKPSSNNSITNDTNNFNPNQITIEDMLRDVKDSNGNVYFQEMNDDVDDEISNARGFTYQRYNFDGTAKENFIVLLKNKSDKSTLQHEFAHVYLTTLNILAQNNAKAKDLLLKVNKYLRYTGGEYTTAQHEKFANSYVAYLKTGKAPTYGLKKVFENFRKWLNDMYVSLITSNDIELDDEAKELFHELLGGLSSESDENKIKDVIEKARNNALLVLGKEKAKKQKIDTNKQLTETQRRYRDTAYDIIFYALTHSTDADTKNFVKDKFA